MKSLGIALVMGVLILLGGFVLMEFLGSQRLSDPVDRCAEASGPARQAFEAGPMARNGLRVATLGAPQRVDPPEGAAPGLVLCRADATFSSGARDTMWYALVPAAEGGAGQFMIHAAPGEMGRRNVLAIR